MKLILTALSAATLTATSAFAVTTPEDRAMDFDQRANGIQAAGLGEVTVPTVDFNGANAVAAQGKTVTLTQLDTDTYVEGQAGVR